MRRLPLLETVATLSGITRPRAYRDCRARSEAYVLQGTVDDDTEAAFDCPCRLERRTGLVWR